MPSLENSLVIEASPSLLWSVLTDSARYGEWNPRLLRVDGVFAGGAVVTLHYKKDSWLPARFVVNVDRCAPEQELRWSGPRNAARALFRASHFFRIAAHARGATLIHGEEFSGVLAPLLFPLLAATVADNHADVNQAIVRRCAALR